MVKPLPTRAASSWLVIAGVCGAAGVALGAMGAHFLPDWLQHRGIAPETVLRRADQFDVAVRYHLLHAVALLAVGGSEQRIAPRALRWIGSLLLAGIVLFSGSLYVLVATNTPGWGAVTPLGGLCWIAAWSVLAIAAARRHA